MPFTDNTRGRIAFSMRPCAARVVFGPPCRFSVTTTLKLSPTAVTVPALGVAVTVAACDGFIAKATSAPTTTEVERRMSPFPCCVLLVDYSSLSTASIMR